MTIELTYLTYTAVLCLLLWLPYIGAGAMKFGFLTSQDYKVPSQREHAPWVERAHRAHLNLIENLPSFVALILIAHVAHISNETTQMAAAMFFWSRAFQTLVHWLGTAYLRTLAFFVGWLSQLMIAYQILTFVN